MFTVVISEKGGAERRELFDRPELSLGRVQGNDLMLPKGNVSKRHARLLHRDGRFIVTDLNREMRERIKSRFDHEGIVMSLPQHLMWQRDQVPDAEAARAPE